MKFQISKTGAGIIVPRVSLLGTKASLQVDLVLDTGAAFTMISWDTAATLGYDPSRRSKSIPIVTANGRIHVPLISVKEIAMQDIKVRNAPVICHDIPEAVEVSGLLGLSFLKYFRTTIDYRSGLVDIS